MNLAQMVSQRVGMFLEPSITAWGWWTIGFDGNHARLRPALRRFQGHALKWLMHAEGAARTPEPM